MDNEKIIKVLILIIVVSLSVLIFYMLSRSFGQSRFEYGRFGQNNKVKIYMKDNQVDLDIYSNNGKLLFSHNKIYYFLDKEEYIYAITKWNEYIVVDLSNNKVVLNTDNPNEVPDEFLSVFENTNQFMDFRDEDYSPSGDFVYFGNDTISLQSYNQSRPYLYTQKTEDGEHFKAMIDESILEYLLVDNFIYLITEKYYYAVVDLNTYNLIYYSWDISKLPKWHQEVFNKEKFIDTQEIYDG